MAEVNKTPEVKQAKKEKNEKNPSKFFNQNNVFRIILGIYLSSVVILLIFYKNKLNLTIDNNLLMLLFIVLSYALIILIITQHRNASNIPLFNNSLAFIVIFASGIASQLNSQDLNDDIWMWVIVGTAAVGSVQNLIAPILEKLTAKK